MAGYEYTLGALDSVIALLVLFVTAWIVFKMIGLVVAFIRFASGDKTAIDRYFDRRRERKGFDALSEGMMALASGEPRLATSSRLRSRLTPSRVAYSSKSPLMWA